MILFYVPCPDAITADRIADTLLHEGLIACANRLAPMQSRFIWEGAVQAEEEVPLLLKTAPARADSVETRVAQLHPYETPAILRLEPGCNSPFADWISATTCSN